MKIRIRTFWQERLLNIILSQNPFYFSKNLFIGEGFGRSCGSGIRADTAPTLDSSLDAFSSRYVCNLLEKRCSQFLLFFT